MHFLHTWPPILHAFPYSADMNFLIYTLCMHPLYTLLPILYAILYHVYMDFLTPFTRIAYIYCYPSHMHLDNMLIYILLAIPVWIRMPTLIWHTVSMCVWVYMVLHMDCQVISIWTLAYSKCWIFIQCCYGFSDTLVHVRIANHCYRIRSEAS